MSSKAMEDSKFTAGSRKKKSPSCRKCEKVKSIFETYKTNMSILHQRVERAKVLEVRNED